MNVVFNSKIAPYESFSVDIEDRSFLYGDGLFETMLYERGAVRLLDYHLARLSRGCHILGLKLPLDLSIAQINSWLSEVVEYPNKHYRIKLILWRSNGGFYTPASDQCNFLLQASEVGHNIAESKQNVVVCNGIANHNSRISPFKTLSSLKYVVAGQEMKDKKGDDIIILDTNGNISEALYSNIFWLKGGVLYTPDTTTGCIEGTMRQYMIDKNQENPIQVVSKKLKTLLTADQVFLTNSMGVCPVRKILDREYDDLSVPKPLQLP